MPVDIFTDEEIFVKKPKDQIDQPIIPVDIPDDDKTKEFFNGLVSPVVQPGLHQSPSNWDAFKHDIKEGSEWLMPYNNYQDNLALENPLDVNVDANWNVHDDPSNFVGLNPKYYPRMEQAKGPKDAKRLNLFLLNKQQEDEFYSRQGLFPNLSSMVVMGATNPSSLMGAIVGAKYAKAGVSVLNKMQSLAPGIATASIMHNAESEATKIGGNVEDFAIDTLSDTIAGLALLGGGLGLSKVYSGSKIYYATRGAIKAQVPGVNLEPVINEDGSLNSIKASPMTGMNVSAAKVDEAQKFADSSFAKEGLFAVPILGGLIGKGIGYVSPVFRMLNSTDDTVAGFALRTRHWGIRTVGTKNNVENPLDFQTIFDNQAFESKRFDINFKGHFAERNKINLENDQISPEEMNYLQSDKAAKWEAYNKEVANVIRGIGVSEHGSVNTPAREARDMMNDTWTKYLTATNQSPKIVPPPTSPEHFPRIHNIPEVQNEPTKWNEMVVSWLKEGDEIIDTHMKPIENIRENIKNAENAHAELIRRNDVTTEEIKKSSDNIDQLKLMYKNRNEAMQNMLREANESTDLDKRKIKLLVEDRSALSADEAKQLKALLKPSEDMESELNKQKELLNQLNKKISSAEKQSIKGKTKETAQKNADVMDKLKLDKEKLTQEVKALQDKLDTEKLRLQEEALSGKIDPILFNKEDGSFKVKFKNPNERLRFRDKFESDHHMLQSAIHLRERILNQTLEDTLEQVMHHQRGGEKELPMMRRTHMIPEEYLVNNNFLSNDVPVILANYRNSLYRKIAFKEAFSDITINGDMDEIVARMDAKFKEKEKIINDKIAKEKDEKKLKELKKERSKIIKDFETNKSDVQLAYNGMMGRTNGSKKQREYTAIVRNLTSATRLGSMPLSMTSDTAAIAYKNGLWPSIRDGFIPAIKSIWDSELRAYAKQNAEHAGLGFNQYLTSLQDKNWAGFAQPTQPITNVLESKTARLAHLTNNLSGSNHLENFNQIWAAGVTESKIIRGMLDWEKGSLSKADRDRLLIYGLDPDKWGERILKNYREQGADGTRSWYWKWNDVEASNKFSQTVYRSVKDTIIRRGPLDAPFMMDDPWASVIFMFKGWIMASSNRYMIPLMQQPDAQHLTGLLLMLGAGSFVTPLRRMSRGENPIQEDDKMFMNAVTDSGILSFPADLYQTAGVLTNNRFVNSTVSDRYFSRSVAGALAGPAFGVADDVAKIIGMTATGNFNHTDIKKATNLIVPFNLWWTKGLVGKGIESLPIPETFSKAESQ